MWLLVGNGMGLSSRVAHAFFDYFCYKTACRALYKQKGFNIEAATTIMKQPDRITTAFTTLREQMLSLAERITGNRDDAADAVQDAFVKLWQQRGRYESASHASGAGMTTVRNASVDLARRNSRRAHVPIERADEAPVEVTDTDRELAYRQVRAIIDKELSPNQRAIIDMREVEGMEFDDIALRLGLQAATVRVELSRARKRVREIYQARRKES